MEEQEAINAYKPPPSSDDYSYYEESNKPSVRNTNNLTGEISGLS
jgi:hypothetical protein